MKNKFKLLTILVMSMSITSISAEDMADATNADGYGTAGCGLGSLAFGPGDGFVQNFAVTTNDFGFGWINSQTIGITLGTSNCTDHKKGSKAAKAEVEQKLFVKFNFNSLQKESARGNGENLSAFAGLMGCNGSSVATFNKEIKSNMDSIFSNQDAAEVVSNVKTIISKNSELAAGCTKI